MKAITEIRNVTRARAMSIPGGLTPLAAVILLATLAPTRADDDMPSDPLSWPSASMDAKPWTRWWWPGSAVDAKNLTRQLEQFAAAGMGGVEICPIYGALGAETRYLPFLSPAWMKMLAHTTREAKRLGLGVDLTTGTGWPFGGPMVTEDHASGDCEWIKRELPAGGIASIKLPTGCLQCLYAWPANGEPVDLAPLVKHGTISWRVPEGAWKLYGIVSRTPIQKVKRAAPGGEGNVLDPYSAAAMDAYLAAFDKAFAGFGGPMPRAHFHDSFEYYKAEWTPALFDEFRKRMGYDLRGHLPEFAGDGEPSACARIRADYRAVISDLHRDYLSRWKEWAHRTGSLVRNQAHGSPGNLLDHYAAADIPETEIFQNVDDRGLPMLQFASSAAHVTGRRLSSSESFTWLDEHFRVKPVKLKDAADYLFLGGVNHIFYHGIPYSPEDAPWPGWLFYASTNMGPNGGLWHDMSAFTGYISRVQSVLQSGKPDSEVLLYFPMDDIRAKGDGMLPLLTVHAQDRWLWPTPFYRAAVELRKQGVLADFVSDDLLANAETREGKIVLGGISYQTLLLPDARLMPVATFRKILKLASEGARIAWQGGWPDGAPGYAARAEWDAVFATLWGHGRPASQTSDGFEMWNYGKGRVARLTDRESLNVPLLAKLMDLHPESMSSHGLQFVRRAGSDGWVYFIANRSGTSFDQMLRTARSGQSAVLLDPRFPDRSGVADMTQGGVHLVLEPGESLVLRVLRDKTAMGRAWSYLIPCGNPIELPGKGRIEFLEGGPVLPKTMEFQSLGSWTKLPDPEALRFAGTARYTLRVAHPPDHADEWMLDLGSVCESASVRVNGKSAGVIWSPPFHLAVGSLLRPGDNTLEIEVTNLAANRIADMDRRKADWKRSREINLVNINYKPFDASAWPPVDSGLLGPVRLVPCKRTP